MADLINTHFINKTNKELNTKIDELWECILGVGGFKKFEGAGTYTFNIPPGLETIYVSAIGAGGGGGGGGGAYRPTADNTNFRNGGAGGGGGGRGEYLLDQIISVTPRETLTVIVGGKGTGGDPGLDGEAGTWEGQNPGNGADGTDGTATILKRGGTVLLSVSPGTRGSGGTKGKDTKSSSLGGTGGVIDGTDGGANTKYASSDQGYAKPGEGGSGGTIEIFSRYGNGGSGGKGGLGNSQIYAKAGADGEDGALVICFGNYRFEAITWDVVE